MVFNDYLIALFVTDSFLEQPKQQLGETAYKKFNMINEVVCKENLRKAYRQVYRNGGSAGVDGLQVGGLYDEMQRNANRYIHELKEGTYQVSAILGVEIPKHNGKTRLLGVPTVVDRVFQQALLQVLTPIFEPLFQSHSYGFRPKRNAHQAVQQSLQFINSGYQNVIDIDLKSFFDEVDHVLLLGLVHRQVKCTQTMKLIRSFLRAPIQVNGKLQKRRKGVPQGSPLSPLLANILLNELDKELVKRGLRYVRYADDFSIYVKSKVASKRVGNSIYKFLGDKLKLPINREKSGIRRPNSFETLGYGFVPTYKKGERGQYQLVVAKSKWETLKQKLKRLTRKTTPASFDERIRDLNWVIRGWVNYFKLGSIQQKLKKLDEWLRNRLRYCIWHDWKKPERKRKNLIRLGIKPNQAYAWSRTRMGGWAVAQSPILITTVTLNRLKSRGYISMLEYYKSVSIINEPPYTRPVRTVV